ncbi:MAG TPA: hypothetical protein VHK88_05115 [Aquihabitans sp.]|nr:hypothetical protein [Aquihabitans sp.]
MAETWKIRQASDTTAVRIMVGGDKERWIPSEVTVLVNDHRKAPGLTLGLHLVATDADGVSCDTVSFAGQAIGTETKLPSPAALLDILRSAIAAAAEPIRPVLPGAAMSMMTYPQPANVGRAEAAKPTRQRRRGPTFYRRVAEVFLEAKGRGESTREAVKNDSELGPIGNAHTARNAIQEARRLVDPDTGLPYLNDRKVQS